MDRCLAMSFTATITSIDQTHDGWIKGCNNQFFCDTKDPCGMIEQMLSGLVSGMRNCKIACSTSDNVQLPGNAGVTTAVNVVTAFLSFVVAVMYAFV